ncbi:MAG: hypothetical protein QM648_06340 [Solirubrobacterales bacterium]
MPRRNTRKATGHVGILHGYNREKDRAPMFRDAEDRRHFKGLFARYLGVQVVKNSKGRAYPNFSEKVRLFSLVLKTNHFHVILLQQEAGAASELMRVVMISYVKYFNAKYGREGALFDAEVRMRPAEGRRDALNLIAYVHENHGDHCYCEFCTHSLYVGHPALVPAWLDVAGALGLFGGIGGYLDWLRARQLQRAVLRSS